MLVKIEYNGPEETAPLPFCVNPVEVLSLHVEEQKTDNNHLCTIVTMKSGEEYRTYLELDKVFIIINNACTFKGN